MIRQPGRYILIDKIPVLCNDLIKWGQWWGTADRRVAYDEVGPCIVSTVFLGLITISANTVGRCFLKR